MGYSYEIAKQVLNENDKNRLMCLYLNCNPSAIDWEKATRAFGAASVDSMRVMTRTALRKIEKAGGKTDDDGNAVAATTTPGTNGGTPKGRKRKAAAATTDEDDEEATPTQKKMKGGGRKLKVKSATPEKEEDAGSENRFIKGEPVEDGDE